jgi:hypothetical protein
MRFVRLSKDTDAARLAEALFVARRGAGTAPIERAATALLAANPQLSGVAQLPKGTIIAVPDVPGASLAKDAELAAPAVGAALSPDALRTQVLALIAAMTKTAKADIEETEGAAKSLRSAEVRKLIDSQAPFAAEHRAELAKNLDARTKQRKGTIATLDAARKAINKDLKKLG